MTDYFKTPVITPFAQDCRGVAPQYDASARAQLREVLFAARHIVTEATGGLPDSRTGQDLLPMLLQGKAAAKRVVDFSRFHTAMLWLGRTLAAVGAPRLIAVCLDLRVKKQYLLMARWLVSAAVWL